jgi:NhaP-type Na+/H+ or K+/H+ antiporter
MWYNLSPEAKKHSEALFHIANDFSEMLIFISIGAQAFFHDSSAYEYKLILLTTVAILIARLVHVTVIIFIANLFRSERTQLGWKTQLLLWWSGLRGAVAFALAVLVPKGYRFDNTTENELDVSEFYNSSEPITNSTLTCELDISGLSLDGRRAYTHQFEARERIITTTLTIIFFTIFVLGGSTRLLLKLLKLSGDNVQPTKEEFKQHIVRRNWLENWLIWLDRTYIIPFVSTTKGRPYVKEVEKENREEKNPTDEEIVEAEDELLLGDETRHHNRYRHDYDHLRNPHSFAFDNMALFKSSAINACEAASNKQSEPKEDSMTVYSINVANGTVNNDQAKDTQAICNMENHAVETGEKEEI